MANTYDDGVLDYFVDLKRKRERNRVTMEWTDELTIRLILAVKNHEALWNTQIIEYRVKNLRETAWREISEKTFNGQVDITEISVKWTNLRIQFRSCFAKKKLEGIEDHFPKWKFYNHMKFIVDIEKKPSNASAITEVSEDEKNVVQLLHIDTNVLILILNCIFVFLFVVTRALHQN